MNFEKYKVLFSSQDACEFMFTSSGLNKLKGASKLGVEAKKDKPLDKLSGKVLFPEKLKKANKIVSKLKWNETA